MFFLSYLLQASASSSLSEGTELCPVYSTFFAAMGSFLSMALTCVGSAYGTAKASVGISSMGVMKPELVMKGILPVIFAGIIPIYGIIICIMIAGHRLFSFCRFLCSLFFSLFLTFPRSGCVLHLCLRSLVYFFAPV